MTTSLFPLSAQLLFSHKFPISILSCMFLFKRRVEIRHFRKDRRHGHAKHRVERARHEIGWWSCHRGCTFPKLFGRRDQRWSNHGADWEEAAAQCAVVSCPDVQTITINADVLQRNFGFLSILALSSTLLSSWEAICGYVQYYCRESLY